MLGISDAHHFRKIGAGVCMVVAPILFLAAAIIRPELHDGDAAQLASVAAHSDRWVIAALCAFVGVIALLPALLGLMHMLRERDVALGHVGGALSLIGIVAVAGLATIQLVIWQMAAAGSQVEMAALLARLTDNAAVLIPVYLLALALPIGVLVLMAGHVRAHVAPWWMALPLAAAVVLYALAFPLASNLLEIVGAAALLVGMGSIGLMVLGETDAEWEHTPEFTGLRPQAGTR